MRELEPSSETDMGEPDCVTSFLLIIGLLAWGGLEPPAGAGGEPSRGALYQSRRKGEVENVELSPGVVKASCSTSLISSSGQAIGWAHR